MRILLKDAGKKFNREWIFRGVNKEFIPGHNYAILGSNGSGKSTLLQLINGNLAANHGSVQYFVDDLEIPQEKAYRRISLGTPYQELIWDFTLLESLQFHHRFKPFLNQLTPKNLLEITGLDIHRNKPLKYFSSGMKQRVRLAIAILSSSDVILLDEPSMNLDAPGREWYNGLLQQYLPGRMLIVCSNHQEEEYNICDEVLDIRDYKNA